VAAPVTESTQEILNGLLLGPKIAVQYGHIGDWPSALLGHQLIDRGVADSGILGVPMLAIHFGHGFTSAFEYTKDKKRNSSARAGQAEYTSDLPLGPAARSRIS
jgi:hypothetical protein